MTFKIRQSKVKFVKVNFNNLKDIARAERVKTRLENKGYKLTREFPTGFDKFVMIYRKK
jgi:hypothetical protein